MCLFPVINENKTFYIKFYADTYIYGHLYVCVYIHKTTEQNHRAVEAGDYPAQTPAQSRGTYYRLLRATFSQGLIIFKDSTQHIK